MKTALQCLWDKYRTNGLMDYKSFSELYQAYVEIGDSTMRRLSLPGEKMFLDYITPGIEVIEVQTGEIYKIGVCLATMGASNMAYAEATSIQAHTDWFAFHIRAMEYFQGVPRIILSDYATHGAKPNLAAEEFAQYYNVSLQMSVKLGDRMHVEFISGYFWTILCKRRFYGLDELNTTIRELLERVNNKPFPKHQESRRSIFEAIEKPALMPLPEQSYEIPTWRQAKISIDSHLAIEGNYYSVPYKLIGKTVDVRMSQREIEVFLNKSSVAKHMRRHCTGRHSTQKEHMPVDHNSQKYSPESLIKWASKIGTNTAKIVEQLLEKPEYPEQAYRSCLGVLSFAKKFGRQKLEDACNNALNDCRPRYGTIKAFLYQK